MTAYVFVGPTLAGAEVRAACDSICLPPVAQGDVYRVALMRPRAIGIVDGYFEGVPAVWHKEILWAMSEGIHVFGSASMGALRAAELHTFGMRGVGRIFEAYRDGDLEDDDEVAVAHGPAETGFVAISEPMVNIRATLDRAQKEGIINPTTRRALANLGKSLFYQERSWDALMEAARVQDAPAAELDALRTWLPDGRIDQKRDDALAMLAAMQELLAGDPEPKRVDFAFEWTELWDDATAFCAVARTTHAEEGGSLRYDRLLDELRLEGDALRQAMHQAFARMLALRESDRQRLGVEGEAIKKAEKEFRARLKLFTGEDLDRWLVENDMTVEEFQRLMEGEARFEALKSLIEPTLERYLRDHLLLRGDYARLAKRARRKQQALAETGLEEPTPQDIGITPAQLRAWYFETRLGRPIPDDIDRFVRELGFSSRADLDRALAGEYVYCEFEERSAES